MRISTILDYIDNGHMALPEFQRGYVWNRDQVRGLMDSLYRRHPVGSLLVWATESKGAQYRGEGDLVPGVVKLLLDGQQRMTTVYGIVRGEPPQFFDGKAGTFTGLYFHVDTEEFRFYQPIKMKDDPLWVDVTRLMQEGIGPFLTVFGGIAEIQPKLTVYVNRLNAIHSIQTLEVHVEEVTGDDKTIDVVVDIFNRVNSGGTKLSKGDLALAKICAEWSGARDTMTASIVKWRDAGYHFNLDWLLRNINTVTTGEALFSALHDVSAEVFEGGLGQAVKIIDYLLNVVAGRLGLDHDRVLFGRYAFPVMARYVDQHGGKLDDGEERDRLLFWYVHSAMWGRYSGSTETVINRDPRAHRASRRRPRTSGRRNPAGAGRSSDTTGAFRRLEPWCALLPDALPAHPNRGGGGLGYGIAAQERAPREAQPAGGSPHLPPFIALQGGQPTPGRQRRRQLLLPHPGDESRDRRPQA